MDTCLPDWNTQLEAELPLPCQRRSLGVDSELVELLWQNGEVVLQSQTHKKPSYDPNKFKQTCRDPNNPIHDDETVSWIQCPIDEAFEKEFCSKFLSEIPSTPVQPSKLAGQFEGHNLFNFGASSNNPAVPSPQQPDSGLNHPLPPPRYSSLFDGPHENRNVVVNGEIVNPLKGKRNINRQCSAVTLGSSHCGSNQVVNDLDLSRASSCGIGDGYYTWKDCTERDVHEQPITSPSGGSGSSSLWKTSNQSNDTSRHKRKSWNMEESECKSDGTESESAAGNKSSQKSGTRRSRVAEVHNLSERKRRDRINEKMRALQELIPNSNRSDKASVLDEAIEYMKSLQLQLQFMWMGRGMAQPMMLPGMQHYMARLGLGMGPPTLPQIQDLMRLSRFPPMINQPVMRPVTSTAPNQATVVGQTHMLSPVNYQNPMQNPCFPEQYANYMAFNSAQNTSQTINMQPANNNHVLARPSNGNGYTG